MTCRLPAPRTAVLVVLVLLTACLGLSGRIVAQDAVVAESTSSFTGVVTSEATGAPLAGVTVRLYWQPTWQPESNWLGQASRLDGVADEEGRFELVSPGPAARWAVGVFPTDTTAFELREGIGSPRPGHQEFDLADVQARPGGRGTGVVRDMEGKPVPGATVEARFGPVNDVSSTTQADETGTYVFEHLPSEFMVSAIDEHRIGLDKLRGRVEVGADIDGLDILSLEPRWIEGRVFDLKDDPVEGARITVSRQSWRQLNGGRTLQETFRTTAVSDPAGEFRFGRVPPLAVDIEVADSLPTPRVHTVKPDTDWIVLPYDPGGSISGTVSFPDGSPATDVEVTVEGREGVRTDGDGRYRIQGLGMLATHILWVDSPDHAVSFGGRLTFGGTRSLEVDVQLERAHTISGRVLTASGRPAEGNLVTVRGGRDMGWVRPSTWEAHAGDDRDVTDAGGRFLIQRLYDGPFRVRATIDYGRGRRLGRASVMAKAGDEDVEIRLPHRGVSPGLVFAVRVLEARTHQPVQRFHLRAGSYAVDVDAPDGQFVTDPLPRESVGIEVSAEGCVSGFYGIDTDETGRLDIEMRLEPEHRVRVRLVDQHGAPLVGARLSASSEWQRIRWLIEGSDIYGAVDDQGEAELCKLPAGRIALHVRLPWTMAPNSVRPATTTLFFDVGDELAEVLEFTVQRP